MSKRIVPFHSNSAHAVLNHFVTVASAAWGHAMIADGENCPWWMKK